MRPLTDSERIRRFMRALGAEADAETRIYFTGGATAVLLGWRQTTVDVDIKIVPDSDRVYRAIPKLKDELQINVELASPDDFIPEVPGWPDRSPFVAREGKVSFHHYDLYAQALSKIERGLDQDLGDVTEMIRRGLVEPSKLRERFEQIEPSLYRYPAIDPPSFRRQVEAALGKVHSSSQS
jgi:hypothetical protein